MNRRAFLFGVVLVAMSTLASGCVGELIPIIGDPEVDEVNAVVDAFMAALEAQDGDSMSGLVASTVNSANEIGWLKVEEGPLADVHFVFDWTGLILADPPPEMEVPGPGAAFGVTDLQYVDGPSTIVSGSTATSTGKVLFTLNHGTMTRS